MERYIVMSVGDYGIGRTCFAIRFSHGVFPDTYIPSNADSFLRELKMSEDKTAEVVIREDDGVGEDYDRLRPLCYPGTDVFIALYSVDSRSSFNNVQKRWIPEVRQHCPTTPIIIVGNKIDLRDVDVVDAVSPEEGLKLAKKMGTSYFEVSVMQNRGVEDCMKHAVEIAELNTKSMRKRLKISSVIIPPIRPCPEPKPPVVPMDSTFCQDWGHMLATPKFHDVKFLMLDGRSIPAHQFMLSSASPLFQKLLVSRTFSKDDILAGKVQGIKSIKDSIDGGEILVELSSDVKDTTFGRILEFVYTGALSGRTDDIDISDLKRTAQMFEMNQLDVECDGVNFESSKKKDFRLVDILKPMAMRDSLHQEKFSDVIFCIEGERISAHRVVIYTRCPKMAELLDALHGEGDSLKEVEITDTSVENFVLLLDYLYTDNPAVDATSDLIGLISLAHKYGAQRLVTLCEVEMKTRHSLDETNVFDLLQKFKEYKTTQLTILCLHYIAQHYSLFSDTEEFYSLSESDSEYVENHRWPSPEYELERESFYSKIQSEGASYGGKTRKCVII